MKIKLTESIQATTDNIIKAQKFIADFSDKLEQSFKNEGFEVDWSWGKPKAEPRTDRDDNLYVSDINLEIKIGNILFTFNADIFNIFGGKFISAPSAHWGFRGTESRPYDFTIEDAEKFLSATKIADSFKQQFISEYNNLISSFE